MSIKSGSRGLTTFPQVINQTLAVFIVARVGGGGVNGWNVPAEMPCCLAVGEQLAGIRAHRPLLLAHIGGS